MPAPPSYATQLPAGWEERVTPEGRTYYVVSASKQDKKQVLVRLAVPTHACKQTTGVDYGPSLGVVVIIITGS
jgi:hypothetical protein